MLVFSVSYSFCFLYCIDFFFVVYFWGVGRGRDKYSEVSFNKVYKVWMIFVLFEVVYVDSYFGYCFSFLYNGVVVGRVRLNFGYFCDFIGFMLRVKFFVEKEYGIESVE